MKQRGMLLTCLLLLLLFLLSSPSFARDPLKDLYLSEHLIELLQSDNQHLQLYTMGYVTGVAYAYDYLAVICMDEESLEQKKLAEQVVSYYEKNPDKRHRLSSVIIKRALRHAYPCE